MYVSSDEFRLEIKPTAGRRKTEGNREGHKPAPLIYILFILALRVGCTTVWADGWIVSGNSRFLGERLILWIPLAIKLGIIDS